MQCYSPAHVQTFSIKILLIFETSCFTEKDKNTQLTKKKRKKKKATTTTTTMKSLFNLVHVKKIDSKGKDAVQKTSPLVN